ncbi:type IV conjugative transfer system pilin TraA [Cedecea neteri]|uniref:type IV conjugative transfer system pilin TraA n=1 Tax=Cedecea neteri TaxID=158822 RepID=UPI00146FE5AA|nr:type IV conjugative transfer system pilin TraA [Cedecea neteri]
MVLSHRGAFSAVKQKVFRREVAHVLVMALLACALFLVLQHAAFAGATKDLLKVGDDAVKGTFGQDSSLMKWLLIGEVVVAIATYRRTTGRAGWPNWRSTKATGRRMTT